MIFFRSALNRGFGAVVLWAMDNLASFFIASDQLSGKTVASKSVVLWADCNGHFCGRQVPLPPSKDGAFGMTLKDGWE